MTVIGPSTCSVPVEPWFQVPLPPRPDEWLSVASPLLSTMPVTSTVLVSAGDSPAGISRLPLLKLTGELIVPSPYRWVVPPASVREAVPLIVPATVRSPVTVIPIEDTSRVPRTVRWLTETDPVSTVTVWLPLICTSSVAVGTHPSFHVEGELQLPLAMLWIGQSAWAA